MDERLSSHNGACQNGPGIRGPPRSRLRSSLSQVKLTEMKLGHVRKYYFELVNEGLSAQTMKHQTSCSVERLVRCSNGTCFPKR